MAEELDDTVESRMGGLLAKDSGYMAQARTRAKQESEQRGLLNTSIAATAGESAAIAAALPIAAQDAQQAYGRNISASEAASRERIATEGELSSQAINVAQIGGRQDVAETQADVDREQLAAQERMTGAEVAGRQTVAETQTGSEAEKLAAQERMTEAEVEGRRTTAAMAASATTNAARISAIGDIGKSMTSAMKNTRNWETEVGNISSAGATSISRVPDSLNWA